MSILEPPVGPERHSDPSSDEELSDAQDGDSDVDFEVEKDESEEELEHLVFGDSAGFRKGLTAVADGRRHDRVDDADVGQAHTVETST